MLLLLTISAPKLKGVVVYLFCRRLVPVAAVLVAAGHRSAHLRHLVDPDGQGVLETRRVAKTLRDSAL